MKRLRELFFHNQHKIYSGLAIVVVIGISASIGLTQLANESRTIKPLSSDNLDVALQSGNGSNETPGQDASSPNQPSSANQKATLNSISNTATLQYCSSGDVLAQCNPSAGVYSGSAKSTFVIKKK